eukprot:7689039-Karenia_brevis.AAC.1
MMSECSTCIELGYVSSQVKIHIAQNHEFDQCQKCYTELECDGVEVTATQFREIVISSKGHAHNDSDYPWLSASGELGTLELLKRFYLDHQEFTLNNGGPFTLGT